MRIPMISAQNHGLAGTLRRRPVISAIAIALGDALIRIPLQFGLQTLLLAPWAEFATLTILAVLTLGLLAVLGWWEETGFNRPSAWRSLGLLWLPAALIDGDRRPLKRACLVVCQLPGPALAPTAFREGAAAYLGARFDRAGYLPALDSACHAQR
jgi:hypothetical protein